MDVSFDSLAKCFLREPTVFADAFNGLLFGGQQVVRAESLKEMDPNGILIPDGIRKDKEGKAFPITIPQLRNRDLLKSAVVMNGGRQNFMILGIEAQKMVDRTMPVRGMIYNAINYYRQMEEIRSRNRDAKVLTKDNYISGFLPTDKLKPVITIVILFSDAEWSEEISIHSLLDVDAEFLKYIPDYKLNVIVPSKMSDDDFQNYSTELSAVLFAAKYSSNKKALYNAIVESVKYGHISRNAALMIESLVGIELEMDENEEIVGMSKEKVPFTEFFMDVAKERMQEAVRQNLLSEGFANGQKEGFANGQKVGEEKGKIEGCITALKSVGMSSEEISRKLMELFGITDSQARELCGIGGME